MVGHIFVIPGRREAARNHEVMSALPGEWGILSLTKKHIVLLSLRGACVPERFLYQWRPDES